MVSSFDMKYFDAVGVRGADNSVLLLIRLKVLNRLHVFSVKRHSLIQQGIFTRFLEETWISFIFLFADYLGQFFSDLLILEQLAERIIWHVFPCVYHLFPLLFDIVLGISLVFAVESLLLVLRHGRPLRI